MFSPIVDVTVLANASFFSASSVFQTVDEQKRSFFPPIFDISLAILRKYNKNQRLFIYKTPRLASLVVTVFQVPFLGPTLAGEMNGNMLVFARILPF